MNAEPRTPDAPIPAGLPRALRPWAPEFQDMPEAHLRLIGGLMGQLNALLEETFEVDAHSYGEFNGYDGMALRGEIERLLPSEWLWKELAPDEFLRRFAEGELLYHRPSFESPTDERTHLVAIDCGPAMLGRPRLIALAALLCLSAIARGQGARLLWTAPQAGVAGWNELLRQRDLKTCLTSANPLSLREAELEGLVRLAMGKKASADIVVWTIGATPLAPADPSIKTNQIVIAERMLLDAEGNPAAEARVGLSAYSGRRKEAVLAFPREEECVSLLREPFRPRPVARGRGTGRPQSRDANAYWAPQGVTLFPEVDRIVLRVRDGLLGVSTIDQGAVFVPLKPYDHLLGMRWTHDTVLLATTRRYNTFSQLKLRRLPLHRPANAELDDIPEIRLDQDDPAALDTHPATALPPLIKPGRKFRLLAWSAKGDRYALFRDRAERSDVRRSSLIGYRDGWGFFLEGEEGARLVIARNLATMQWLTFALPANADVRDLSDIVYWPEELKAHSGTLLLARCDDGHWRGQMGKVNIAGRTQFADKFIDVDLSALGHAVPLGHYWQQRGKPPYPAYRACFWSPRHRDVHYCGFTLVGRVDIEKLDVPGMHLVAEIDPARPEARRPHIIMHKGTVLSWKADADGFPEEIQGGYSVYHPEKKDTRFHTVTQLMREAKCLSG
jgi:hypothetical protein